MKLDEMIDTLCRGLAKEPGVNPEKLAEACKLRAASEGLTDSATPLKVADLVDRVWWHR